MPARRAATDMMLAPSGSALGRPAALVRVRSIAHTRQEHRTHTHQEDLDFVNARIPDKLFEKMNLLRVTTALPSSAALAPSLTERDKRLLRFLDQPGWADVGTALARRRSVHPHGSRGEPAGLASSDVWRADAARGVAAVLLPVSVREDGKSPPLIRKIHGPSVGRDSL